MSQACFNTLKKLFLEVDKEYEAYSFGTTPGTQINPKVKNSLLEIGIDLSNNEEYFPKDYKHELVQGRLKNTTHAFTMGCMGKACGFVPGLKITDDWALDDPATVETDVKAVRNEVLGRCLELIKSLAE